MNAFLWLFSLGRRIFHVNPGVIFSLFYIGISFFYCYEKCTPYLSKKNPYIKATQLGTRYLLATMSIFIDFLHFSRVSDLLREGCSDFVVYVYSAEQGTTTLIYLFLFPLFDIFTDFSLSSDILIFLLSSDTRLLYAVIVLF